MNIIIFQVFVHHPMFLVQVLDYSLLFHQDQLFFLQTYQKENLVFVKVTISANLLRTAMNKKEIKKQEKKEHISREWVRMKKEKTRKKKNKEIFSLSLSLSLFLSLSLSLFLSTYSIRSDVNNEIKYMTSKNTN